MGHLTSLVGHCEGLGAKLVSFARMQIKSDGTHKEGHKVYSYFHETFFPGTMAMLCAICVPQ